MYNLALLRIPPSLKNTVYGAEVYGAQQLRALAVLQEDLGRGQSVLKSRGSQLPAPVRLGILLLALSATLPRYK